MEWNCLCASLSSFLLPFICVCQTDNDILSTSIYYFTAGWSSVCIFNPTSPATKRFADHARFRAAGEEIWEERGLMRPQELLCNLVCG